MGNGGMRWLPKHARGGSGLAPKISPLSTPRYFRYQVIEIEYRVFEIQNPAHENQISRDAIPISMTHTLLFGGLWWSGEPHC